MIPPPLVELQNLTSAAGEEAASNATLQQQATDSKTDKVSGQPVADAETAKEKKLAAPAIAASEEPKPAANQSEEIPSFNEWAQKQLAEAEKKKGQCFYDFKCCTSNYLLVQHLFHFHFVFFTHWLIICVVKIKK